MRSFIAATLISAVAAETYTHWSTDVETVTSCAASVTDCPARSTETAWTNNGWGGWGSESWTGSWTSSAAASTTPVTTSASTWTSTSSAVSSPATSTPSSTWSSSSSAVTSSPASSSPSSPASSTWSSSSAVSSPVSSPASSASSTWSSTWSSAVSSPVTSAASSPSAPATTPVGPTWSVPGGNSLPAWSGASSGWAKSVRPTGTGSYGGSWATATGTAPIQASTGGASALNAAGVLAGAGAVLAFLL